MSVGGVVEVWGIVAGSFGVVCMVGSWLLPGGHALEGTAVGLMLLAGGCGLGAVVRRRLRGEGGSRRD